MRPLVWVVDMSLDGFMSGPKGELDWAGGDMDDELWDDVNVLLRTVDAALFGRKTYRNFEEYWPAVLGDAGHSKNEVDFAQWIEATTKIVASNTVGTLEWKNSILLKGDLAEEVSQIKAQAGKKIVMFGSCTLAGRLLQLGLIDELCLRIHPVILGSGRPLFQAFDQRRRLKLTESRRFRSGLVQLKYER
jgi:dihydrofolate reductase